MVTEFLTWAVSLLSTLVHWLNSMDIVSGVSLLAFFAAIFAIGLLMRALLVH